jgi:hypothetical protein
MGRHNDKFSYHNHLCWQIQIPTLRRIQLSILHYLCQRRCLVPSQELKHQVVGWGGNYIAPNTVIFY